VKLELRGSSFGGLLPQQVRDSPVYKTVVLMRSLDILAARCIRIHHRLSH